MKRKTSHFLIMVLLGVSLAMLLYGFSLHVAPIYSENNDKGFATAEPQLIKEVSIGGLERKPDGKLHKTYTGKAPAFCST
jgi:hypothetical protein